MLKTYAVEPSAIIKDTTGEEIQIDEPASSVLPLVAGVAGSLVLIGIIAVIATNRRKETQLSASIVPDAPLPLPPEGLPEGWTMEQWQYYGLEYLRGER